MTLKTGSIRYLVKILSDVFVAYISIVFALLIKYEYFKYINIYYILIFIMIKIFMIYIFGNYSSLWRYTNLFDLTKIIIASFISTCILISWKLLTPSVKTNFNISFLILDFVIATILFCILRITTRTVSQRSYLKNIIRNFLNNNINLEGLAIIGAGDAGERILKEIHNSKKKKFNVIGLFDDDLSKVGKYVHGIKVHGTIEEIKYHSDIIDEIFICVPSANNNQMRRIIEICKSTGKKYRTLPSLAEIIDDTIKISGIRDVSMTDILGREEIKLDKKSISQFLLNKKILITGAGGSIGSELVRQCLGYKPGELLLLDNSEYNLFKIDNECKLLNKNRIVEIIPILADIKDKNCVEKYFIKYKPNIVIHAAAYKHVPMQEEFPWEAIFTNVIGSKNIIDLSHKYNVESFVLVSSDKAVKPANIMGATKRIAEMLIQDIQRISKTHFIAVRFGNVLCSSGSVIPIFQEQIKNGGPVNVTHPEMTRYFMSIPEASQLILQAASLGKGGEIFILKMGSPINIDYLARELIKLYGYEPDIDIKIQYTGVRPGEKLHEDLYLDYENFISTKHEKILVLNNNSKYTILDVNIKNLIDSANRHDKGNIEKYLSALIPEYIPHFNEKRLFTRINR